MIKKGGININPNEINEILLKHNAVLESTIVGIPDRHYGEEVIAFVVLSNTISEISLLNYIRQFFPVSHVPKKVIFCDSLPKGSYNKVQNHILKKMITHV